MKLKILVAVIGLVVAGALCASAQTAYSVNVVGFQKIPAPTSEFALGGMPFVPADPDIQEVIGAQLTGKKKSDTADNLYLWDLVGQTYRTLWLNSSTTSWTYFGGSTIATDEIPDGAAFFLENRQSVDEEQIMVGDVVEDDAVTNVMVPGFTMLAYPFSADVDVQDLTFQNAVAKKKSDTADHLFLWRAQTYKDLWLDANTTNWTVFGGGISTDVLYGGEGFIYQSKQTQNVTWIQARPYTL